MTREQHLRMALRDIRNPHHKRSAKYGWEGVAKIKEGGLFVLIPSRLDPDVLRADPAYIEIRAAGSTVDRDFETVLTEASVPVQATTWDGVALLMRYYFLGDPGWLAERLLQRLIDRNQTSAGELLELAAELDREDEEQDRRNTA